MEKVVSFFMINCSAGFKGGCLAICNIQKIGAADGFHHTLPGWEIAGIISTVPRKGFAQDWNSGRVQCCQTLFELKKIWTVIFAVAKSQDTVLTFSGSW